MTDRDDADRAPPPALDPLHDEALRWFLALQAAPDDSQLRRDFEAWRTADRRNADAFTRMTSLWGSAEFGAAVTRTAPAPRADRPSPVVAFGPSPARRWTRRVAAMAATLMVAAALLQVSGLATRLRADHATGIGEQRRVVLSDGSVVRLNSRSALAVDFDGKRRSVRLMAGEAFFEVTRDVDRPFRVIGPHSEVEVTGTAFSVRAESAVDDVTLEHGRVAVSAREGGAVITLQPLQSIAVGAGQPSHVRAVDAETAFAWLDGRIRFRDRPLAEVLDELRRYHRGVIIVADGRYNSIKVTGNYRVDAPANVVESLASAVGAKLTRLSDYVLILR